MRLHNWNLELPPNNLSIMQRYSLLSVHFEWHWGLDTVPWSTVLTWPLPPESGCHSLNGTSVEIPHGGVTRLQPHTSLPEKNPAKFKSVFNLKKEGKTGWGFVVCQYIRHLNSVVNLFLNRQKIQDLFIYNYQICHKCLPSRNSKPYTLPTRTVGVGIVKYYQWLI